MTPTLIHTPWVTPTMAARAARRSRGTIWTWMRTGQATSMCTTNGRLTVVYWPDVYDLTFSETRRLRAAMSNQPAAAKVRTRVLTAP